jgi:DNA-binding XRE family transcriptional regulator
VVSPEAGIDYTLHSPPLHWGAPKYSILRWTVSGRKKTGDDGRYFSHCGEEVIFTDDPGVCYGFFDPGNEDEDKRYIVKPGELMRIRPRYPHYNYRETSGRNDPNKPERPPRGWLVLRSLSGTAITDTFPLDDTEDPTLGRPNHPQASDLIKPSKLKNPSSYALVSLGISERLRRTRQRSGLTINQLADEIGMNASFLGKLESGDANISIDHLNRIAASLGMDMIKLPDEFGQDHIVDISRSFEAHWLHPRLHYPGIGTAHVLNKPPDRDGPFTPVAGECSSWIVAKGKVIFQVNLSGETTDGEETTVEQILSTNDVLHLRQSRFHMSVQALQQTTLIEVRYSSNCSCHEHCQDCK